MCAAARSGGEPRRAPAGFAQCRKYDPRPDSDGDSVEAGMVAAFPVAESFHDPPCGAANAVCGRRQGSATATQEGR